MKLEVSISMGVLAVGILVGLSLLFAAASGVGGGEAEHESEAQLCSQLYA